MASLAESMFSFYYESTPEPDDDDDMMMIGEEGLGTFYYESRSNSPEVNTAPEPAALRLPVEILDAIFKLVTPNPGHDVFESLGDLLSCALTCRVSVSFFC
jgi:hypothetical protein